MSGFYASKRREVAAHGQAHNDAMRKRFPTHEDRVRALNANVMFSLTGDVPEVTPKSPRSARRPLVPRLLETFGRVVGRMPGPRSHGFRSVGPVTTVRKNLWRRGLEAELRPPRAEAFVDSDRSVMTGMGSWCFDMKRQWLGDARLSLKAAGPE